MSAIDTGPRALTVAGPRPSRHAPRGSSRLFKASPLTYVTLVATVALSVFPIYWMLVVATRTNDVVGDVPSGCSRPRRRTSPRACSTPRSPPAWWRCR